VEKLRVLRSLTLVSVSVMAMSVAARAQTGNIDIPAGNLSAALDSYIIQSGVELFYKADDIVGMQSRAVHGALTPEQALDRLLAGTSLVAQRGPNGAVVLVRAIGPPADLPSSGIIETVVVTGSRVISDAANSPTPLTMVRPDQLLATTPTTIADALNKLPQFMGSSSRRTAGGASSNGGGDYLNLRNFGQQRTLVLQDGMRVPASNANGSVDVSTLPQMLVSRVDIVTAGASAVYGSDAITGVVNFILDKNFTGVKYQANAGLSTYADGFSDQVGIAAGTSLFGGRGHLEGELFYNHADEVEKQTRPQGDFSSYGTGTASNPITNIPHGRLNTSSPGGKITCTNCSVNGGQFTSNDLIGPFYNGVQTSTSTISQGGDGGYWSVGSALAATSRQSGFGRFSYDLGDNTLFFAQFTGAQARVFDHYIPSQIDVQRQTLNYFKNNPYLPASQQALLGDDSAADPTWAADGTNIFQSWKWISPLIPGQTIGDPTRRTNSVQRNLTFTIGLSGQVFGGYDWNFHYTHGEARDSVTGINNGNNQYADASHDAVLQNGQVVCYNDTAAAIALYGNLYPGCVPMNAFGPTSISESAFAYWSRNTNFIMTNKMDDLAGDISGNLFDLPAGPVRGALAGEMRWLGYIVNSNASPTAVVNCYGLRLCGSNPGTGPVPQSLVTQTLWDNNTLASVSAAEDVWEFSGELNIPILKDLPFVESLSSDVAGRYTDYSVSGAVQTWKVGLDWRINGDFRVRGTTSVDIRAPTLNDLYSPPTETSSALSDALTNTANGVELLSQGNPNLVPEVSRTYTAGLVYTPSYIPGLTASVDFYNINLKNAIGNVSASSPQVETICNASLGASPYCALYVRPFPYTNTTPANFPTLILSESLNSAFTTTEGEDYEFGYHFDAADMDPDLVGLVSLRAFANVAPKIDASQFPGAQITHTTGQKGHATVMAGYTLGDWSANYQWTWYSDEWKNSLLATPQYYAQPRVPSFNTSDITITRKVSFGNASVASLYVTVNNIANGLAPIVTGVSSNPGAGLQVPVGEDVMGRYFTIGIRGNL
jgi:iron complex outermembrane receptor protein